jgi:hypothetical protein
VLGESAHGRCVPASVVVDDDHHRPVRCRRDVVEGLPGQPSGECSVADDGDDVPVRLSCELCGLGHAVGVRQGHRCVGVLDVVVRGLLPARVSGKPATLPQAGELTGPPRHDLVDVRLVPDVPQQPVARGVEDPVQRQGQFHDAEVGPQMASRGRDMADQEVADLPSQPDQLWMAQTVPIQ